MSAAERLVLDTNVLLSGILFSGSSASRVLLKAQHGTLLASDATLLELMEAMGNPGFDAYVARRVRQQIIAELACVGTTVEILSPLHACSDPRLDKFLEVAVHGRAQTVVTRDHDLLGLNPFRGIAILTPADYLALE